tara:strand:- start:1454 stop:1720 length:267 start_codon:yes stop_codon:yes gene_type:complete
MANGNPIYLGGGKEKFDGDQVNISINLSKLENEAQEYIYEFKGEKYIKLNVNALKDGIDQYGRSHSVQVDTFKPDKPKESKMEDDLPF